MSGPTLASTDAPLSTFAAEVGDHGPVAVEGARTRWDLGGPSSPGTRLVRPPDGIVSYAPEEMTVTVRAGTLVETLQKTLAERSQRTALPNRGGTVGGALAVGENDFRAMGRGLIRTALLQVRYVSAEGRIVTSGGPTVKNVTGFDLPRLMVGSLGTLGLIGEVILRTNPIPAVSRWLQVAGPTPRQVADAVVAPSAVLSDGTSTWVQLEGHGVDVEAEQRTLGHLGDVVEVAGPPEFPPYRWSLTPGDLHTNTHTNSNTNSDTGPNTSSETGPNANAHINADTGPNTSSETGAYVAVIGEGLVFAERPQQPRPLAPELAVIHQRLKDNFDPTGRLNPGRDAGRK